MKYMINIHLSLLLARDHYLQKSREHPMFSFLNSLITKPWAKLIQHADVSLEQLLLYAKSFQEAVKDNKGFIVIDYNPEGDEYVMWESTSKVQEIARGPRDTVLTRLYEWLLAKRDKI